jgi:hypothetical protein
MREDATGFPHRRRDLRLAGQNRAVIPAAKIAAGASLLAACVAWAACAHQPPPPPPPSAEGADVSKSRQKALDRAVSDLVKEIHSPKEDVATVSENDVTWEDSCLGCAKTGEKCLHVLTPGYVITLRVRDATYEYHTDRSGHDARLCGQAPVAPPPAQVIPPAPTPSRK